VKKQGILPTQYKSISCDLYDHLEIWAMRKEEVLISFINESNTDQQLKSIISDLITLNSEEFIITQENLKIRLDRIIQINDLKFDEPSCQW
jgi:transcriptional antiterminator Rof (Rho-off)